MNYHELRVAVESSLPWWINCVLIVIGFGIGMYASVHPDLPPKPSVVRRFVMWVRRLLGGGE